MPGCLLLCRFLDAGMPRRSTRLGGRRSKSAKARNRGKGYASASGSRQRRANFRRLFLVRKPLAMMQRRDGRRVVRVVAFAIGCMSKASIAPRVHRSCDSYRGGSSAGPAASRRATLARRIRSGLAVPMFHDGTNGWQRRYIAGIGILCDDPLKQLDCIMTLRSLSAGNAMRSASFVLVFWLVNASGHAQGASPFDEVSGQWSGSGTIDLANGAIEPIRCRATYDVLEQQNNLQLNIRCASDSYSFDMRASATLASNAISGSWSESSRNVAGKISGTARWRSHRCRGQWAGVFRQSGLEYERRPAV